MGSASKVHTDRLQGVGVVASWRGQVDVEPSATGLGARMLGALARITQGRWPSSAPLGPVLTRLAVSLRTRTALAGGLLTPANPWAGERRSDGEQRTLTSAHSPSLPCVVLQKTEKFVYQEVVSPLRRLVSCHVLDMLPQPTLHVWPLNPTTRFAFEYRSSWQQRGKRLRASTQYVPFGLTPPAHPVPPSSSSSSSSFRPVTAAASASVSSAVTFVPIDCSNTLSDALHAPAVRLLPPRTLVSVGQPTL